MHQKAVYVNIQTTTKRIFRNLNFVFCAAGYSMYRQRLGLSASSHWEATPATRPNHEKVCIVRSLLHQAALPIRLSTTTSKSVHERTASRLQDEVRPFTTTTTSATTSTATVKRECKRRRIRYVWTRRGTKPLASRRTGARGGICAEVEASQLLSLIVALLGSTGSWEKPGICTG